MDEITRLQTSMDQLTRRVDDHAFRLAAVEASDQRFLDKLDSIRELFDLQFKALRQSMDAWNRIGFWLLTTTAGAIIVAIVTFALRGGFSQP